MFNICLLISCFLSETVDDALVILCDRWNEQLQASEQRKLRVAMLCGVKGDLQGATVWQQDIIVITAGTRQHLDLL